jgi:hypothetical protein
MTSPRNIIDLKCVIVIFRRGENLRSIKMDKFEIDKINIDE